MIADRWTDTSDEYKLAVTVATFAEVLRGSQYAADISLEQVGEEANGLANASAEAAELADLVQQAARLR